MAQILVLASTADTDVLPALGLLSHKVRTISAEPASLISAPVSDIVILDARRDLVNAKSLAKVLLTTGMSAPLILVVTEAGLPGINAEWGAADIILEGAGPGEIDARIRIALGRGKVAAKRETINEGGVIIDEASYSAKVHGKPLDLTFKEFELLRFLAQHPGRVFTREQLLSEVWGYDYFGGTRTVDVHIRRLRAKLGDLEALIGTVRNVGYRFNVSLEADFASSEY
jgi:DNA-binding response OmpR family regulator